MDKIILCAYYLYTYMSMCVYMTTNTYMYYIYTTYIYNIYVYILSDP